MAAGAAVVAPGAALVGGGVNLGGQLVKGEAVSPTEVMTSTIMGPLGAAATEAKIVKDIVEAGGPAGVVLKAGIGAATNTASDTTSKALKNEEITAAGVAKAGVAGAVGTLPKSQVMQNVITEAVNSAIDAVTKPEKEK